MNRRGFIGSAIAAVAGWLGVVGKVDGEHFRSFPQWRTEDELVKARSLEPENLVKFWRLERGQWVRRRVAALRKGDTISCDHEWAIGKVWAAISDPWREEDGGWAIKTDTVVADGTPCPPA